MSIERDAQVKSLQFVIIMNERIATSLKGLSMFRIFSNRT
jgi:hypothetical protein